MRAQEIAPLVLRILGMVQQERTRPDPGEGKHPVLVNGKIVMMTPEEERQYHMGTPL